MRNLSDRLDNFPEPWKPKPGEKLLGELVDIDVRESDYGDPYPILTVLDAEGREWAWHAYHAISRSEVARKRPQIGEQIGIAYHGPGKAAPGMNAPERWRLLVDRPNQQATDFDWGAIAPTAEEADTPPSDGSAEDKTDTPPSEGSAEDKAEGDDIPF